MPPRDPAVPLARARQLAKAGRVEEAARVLLAAGLVFEAAQCHLDAGDAAAALEKLLRVGSRDTRYREAARLAVGLASDLDALSARFEHFMGGFISSGPETEADLQSFVRLGELYMRHGMLEIAEEAFATVVARSPDFGGAAGRLAALRTTTVSSHDALATRLGKQDDRTRKEPPRPVPVDVAPTPRPRDLKPTRRIDQPTPPAKEAQPDTFATGSVVANRYRIEGEIGRGGMATVYRAHDLELTEDGALKLFRPTGHDEEGIARFRQELKLSRRLAHRNITRVYDLGVHHGHRYISMELLVGQSLEELNRKPWPLARAVDCLVQVCEGLEAAHAHGVVHRDIKPGNLFLTREGVAKIMDFGIARERSAPGVTQVGMILGTPEYMSPEQIRGEGATEKSDLYALGVVAYEMFAGRKPFVHASLFPLLQMHLGAAPVPLRQVGPGLPPELETVVLKLLEKNPARRYADARALANALSAIALPADD